MQIALVAAVGEEGVIGRAGTLPWSLPADLKHFREVTMGKPVVMGRKTFESIGKPLPGRVNIVISRDRAYAAAGCTVVGSLEAAMAAAVPAPEVMVVGGSAVFAEALPRADRIHLTRVHGCREGDVRFPELDWDQWRVASRQDHPADARHRYACTFFLLERIAPI